MSPKTLPKPVVLFDGSCKFCVTTSSQLRDRDKDEKIEWLDLHAESTRKRFPGIDWKRAEEEIHLIHKNGRIVVGSRAVRDIAEIIGGDLGAAAAELMKQPGLREASDFVYKLISDNRSKISEAMTKAEEARNKAEAKTNEARAKASDKVREAADRIKPEEPIADA